MSSTAIVRDRYGRFAGVKRSETSVRKVVKQAVAAKAAEESAAIGTGSKLSGKTVRVDPNHVTAYSPSFGYFFTMGANTEYKVVGSVYHSADCCELVLVLPDGVRGVYLSPKTRVFVTGRWSESDLNDAEYASLILRSKQHELVGMDPEVFAFKKDGTLLPAFEFLGSKKDSPVAYWDGYQAEFTTRPEYCLDSQRFRMSEALGIIYSKLPSGAYLSLQNVVDIPHERLMNDDPKYVAFGCTPSLNAYGEECPAAKVDSSTIGFRSAGGHLHFSVGSGRLSEARAAEFVKRLDAILGVISVAMFQYYDTPRRRMYYGRAGEYRLTTYGFEYRVLSNAWLCHGVAYNLVYEIARRVNGMVLKSLRFDWDASEDEVRECINRCDAKLANAILERNDRLFSVLLRSLPNMNGSNPLSPTWVRNLKKLIKEGIHTRLKNPDRPASTNELMTQYAQINHLRDGKYFDTKAEAKLP